MMYWEDRLNAEQRAAVNETLGQFDAGLTDEEADAFIGLEY
jgi:hypothetical protein